ncbi:hypothetical protein ACX0FC_19045, partial [Enterococcus faecium]
MSYAQTDSLTNLINQYPDKLNKQLLDKYQGLEKGVTKSTEKYLIKLQKQENKLYKKINKVDSAKAKEL